MLGLLHTQLTITAEGLDAFLAWARGDAAAQAAVRTHEHRADQAKRELYRALRTAFVTPLEPEDLFALSRGTDRILNQAKDIVREAKVMDCAPDAPLAAMAEQVAGALRSLDAAVEGLRPGAQGSTAAAEAAIKHARRIERVYRSAMAELLIVDDLPVVMARRELYRRGERIADAIEDVAERVLYAVVKEA